MSGPMWRAAKCHARAAPQATASVLATGLAAKVGQSVGKQTTQNTVQHERPRSVRGARLDVAAIDAAATAVRLSAAVRGSSKRLLGGRGHRRRSRRENGHRRLRGCDASLRGCGCFTARRATRASCSWRGAFVNHPDAISVVRGCRHHKPARAVEYILTVSLNVFPQD